MIRLLTALGALLISGPVLAEPTTVTVRVIAADAKFIGTSMGGVKITLRDAKTGKLLAQGLTAGGTGETEKIMHASGRNPARAGDGVAGFSTSLDLKQPTLVALAVEGPLGFPGSVLRASQQRWIMPGQPVTQGDGWVIELPGLVITPTAVVTDGSARIEARVQLMCGCPITPGGLWDAADYKVQASLWQAGKQVAMSDLAFATAPGGYRGSIALPGKGRFRLIVAAQNIRTGNSGVTETMIAAD